MSGERPPPANLVMATADGGRLAENIVHFARVLRGAGMAVGPGRIADALAALAVVGVGSRTDFYWTLHAVFVSRRDQRTVFDQAFHLFWRDPDLLRQLLGLLLPTSPEAPEDSGLLPRVAEALARRERPEAPKDPEAPEEITVDAALSFSPVEALATKDFEKMTAAEYAEAKRAARALALPVAKRRSRRCRADPGGSRLDPRASLRALVRQGGDLMKPCYRKPRQEPPPLVVLCDISGSMERYARILLQFIVGLAGERQRLGVFLFGTRLTNVSRGLRERDADAAVARVAAAASDWAGGTRIAACLRAFNRDWSRRVLGPGAVVLLITDGLDRDDPEVLETEVARLARSCHCLLWLNPLLRYDGYQPRARGARALIGHVHGHRPVHNLTSLADLASALASGGIAGRGWAASGRAERRWTGAF
ncbi:vWA domain-containing protein [Rhodospirillum rubrum]|uniref:VWA containing CoxE-like n=1 Tax=Rhodospirillum rubrum (strain ATCC 11170 / ATH 1.1.1 / DSM 467 / LMG 4362 / NCIMB 8255 / S1) TaxID=269796 RepID=Q2RVS5_RHORT|nr:VWA domain-containing protein [Rhodospirillum rubrum]ABC21770.1 VWA containing CoxE-like [Rhodospirillum rubrum ATCC 11170]AEO47468.1 VWA containing CoxE-like protein [Rhodospirillum rubrum F11]MBK5953327.1 VWA domain-containing protein [Rhodospirillum rubrum]QXG81432.1 VWA domain-containing protein [Rhodospirillum rubrum]HCF19069.1 VWA domain-containing protein [Rhodospirillum rubrum]